MHLQFSRNAIFTIRFDITMILEDLASCQQFNATLLPFMYVYQLDQSAAARRYHRLVETLASHAQKVPRLSVVRGFSL